MERFRAGKNPLSRLNALPEAIERLQRGGRSTPPGAWQAVFPARIIAAVEGTDGETGDYTFLEVYWDPAEEDWADYTGARGSDSVDTCREINALTDVKPDDIVWMHELVDGIGQRRWFFAIAPPRGMIPVRCWQDGGYTDGDADNQCDRTYTVRTLEATAIDAGGELLGEHMVPRTRQATAYKCQMDCPPAEGGGWIGIGYEDENGAFALFDSGERPVTVAYDSCPNCEPEEET